MAKDGLEARARYMARDTLKNTSIGWGLFLMFALMPVFLVLTLLVDVDFMLAYLVMIFSAFGTIFVLERWTNKARFGFWLRSGTIERIRSVGHTAYMFLAGLVVGTGLTIFAMWVMLNYRFGVGLHEYVEVSYVQFVAFGEFVLFIPLLYLINRHLKNKHGLEMMRSRFFRESKGHVDEIVKTALGSLSLDSRESKEGSKWTVLIPVLKIDNHDISIHTFDVWPNHSGVTITARRAEDYHMAERIEKSIDAHHSMSS